MAKRMELASLLATITVLRLYLHGSAKPPVRSDDVSSRPSPGSLCECLTFV